MSAPDAQREPVEELAEDFARRLRLGERPSLSEYTSRHPELANDIRELFPALVVMEQFGSVTDPDARHPVRHAPPTRLGDYRIVREVGRGGMGIVYEAIQESLGRHVALKVLFTGPSAPVAARERFRREAKAAAQLHHTNIVPVFAVGEFEGTLYYAMQFIRGQGLDSVVEEVRRLRSLTGPPAPTDTPSSQSSGELAAQPESRYCRAVARLGLQAAEALQHAHQQGILHRDVKPSNLLLDHDGTLWVTDFGLAKANDSGDLTGSGDLIGTLRYMAPERFRGNADARSDVYSLGITLYEMLALRPAFDDADRLRVIERIGRDDPPRLKRLVANVPRDFETVIQKAIARSPGDRYRTSQDLADDLRRYLDGRPVKARRHSWAEQVWRWCRRRPGVATLIGVVAVLLVTVAVGASVSAVRLRSALTQANDNLARAESAEIDADTNRWRGHVLDARSSRLSRAAGQRVAALAALQQAVEIARARGMPPERFAEMRTEAIAALALPDLYVQRWWPGRPKGIKHFSFSKDLETYARVDSEGAVCVRRVSDDAERFLLPSLGGATHTVLSPNGGLLFQFQVTAPYRGRLWDLSRTPPVIRLEESALGGNHHFRRDGQQITLTFRNGEIGVYTADTGQRQQLLAAGKSHQEIWLDPHPVRPYVAVSSYFHTDVFVRDLTTGATIAQAALPWKGGGFATWHPSGRALCVCQGDGTEVAVFDFNATGEPELSYHRSFYANVGGGGWMAFNPAGDRAVISGWFSNVVLCDFETGRSLVQTPPSRVAMQFDISGTRLAAAAREGNVGIWSMGDGRECRAIVHGRPTRIRTPALNPDGQIVAVVLADGLVLFDVSNGRELAALPFRKNGEVGSIGSFQFDSSGALLTNSMDGCFRWPIRSDPDAPGNLTLGPPEQLPFYPGDQAIAASRDGRVVAQAMWNGYGMQQYAGGWIMHPDRPGKPVRVAAGESASAAVVSPNGRLVAFGLQTDRRVRVYDSASFQQLWSVADGARCQFTPDGRWLATDTDGIRLYSADTGAPGARLGPGVLECFSPDGRLAILGSYGGTFRIVDVESGRELARLEDPEQYAELATFTPDNTRLVALARDGLRVWDLRAIRKELAALGLDWDAPPYPPATATKPIERITVIGAELMGKPP